MSENITMWKICKIFCIILLCIIRVVKEEDAEALKRGSSEEDDPNRIVGGSEASRKDWRFIVLHFYYSLQVLTDIL